jgi:uncharacterized membrane protein YidH (DUF202 family)
MENEEILKNTGEGEEDEEKSNKKAGKKIIQNERTRTAFERLQLAWIRTSLTLMAIGIGALEYYTNRIESGKEPYLKMVTGSELGLFLIVTSFVVLIQATIQHINSMSQLKKYYPEMRYSVATVLSLLILGLTFLVSFMIFLRFKSGNL